jgi:hypothetical protein
MIAGGKNNNNNNNNNNNTWLELILIGGQNKNA